MIKIMSFEKYSFPLENNIIGQSLTHEINGQKLDILYTDWTASGRLYTPIENYITNT